MFLAKWSLMNNRIIVSCLLTAVIGTSPIFILAGKKTKKQSINMVIKGKKVAHYWVRTDYIQKSPLKPARLTDLIEDLIELQPKVHGYSLPSKRHKYYITCIAQTQANMQDEQFVKLLVWKEFFIIPAVDTVIGTIGGATYRLESAKRVKATLKNPEQIELVLSVNRWEALFTSSVEKF